MNTITVKVEKDDINPQLHMITVQAEGYPSSVGFIDKLGDTCGIGGETYEIIAIAKEVWRETKLANLKSKVILDIKELKQ